LNALQPGETPGASDLVPAESTHRSCWATGLHDITLPHARVPAAARSCPGPAPLALPGPAPVQNPGHRGSRRHPDVLAATAGCVYRRGGNGRHVGEPAAVDAAACAG